MDKFYADIKNEKETEKALKAFKRAEKEQAAVTAAPSIFDDEKDSSK